MNIFRDFYHNEVKLSFQDHPFSQDPKHVWVVCRLKEKWLLTNHRDRGLEFPGGKVEKGETPEEAAKREVMEETGGVIESLHYVGQYLVAGKSDTIIKNVYFACIETLESQETYYETAGPALLSRFPTDIRRHPHYSFIMKDNVLPLTLNVLHEQMNIINQLKA